MNIKPMIFNTEMVRSLLDGRKVQTRRPFTDAKKRLFEYAAMVGECSYFISNGYLHENDTPYIYDFSPVDAGDLIYVRETFRLFDSSNECGCSDAPCGCPRTGTPIYFSDCSCSESKWTPSIHMPRWASRLTLKVTGVRVERVQDISKADAEAEGFKLPPVDGQGFSIGAKTNFRHAWEKIYGDSWERNDWVWVIDFEVIRQNVDEYLKEQERTA